MATKISTLINEASMLRPLAGELDRLQRLHHVYTDAVPGRLLRASRVGYLDKNILIIIASSGTAAAGLRQLTTGILAKIQQLEPEITGVRVQVQIEMPSGDHAPKGGQRQLSARAATDLGVLAARLAESPLKQALTKLKNRAHSDKNEPLNDVKQGAGRKQDHKKPK